jgi:predicted PurR-regulated permease PerM
MVGISPLLTIVAITLGGDIGGFFGMFFGIPALAALKLLIVDRLWKGA